MIFAPEEVQSLMKKLYHIMVVAGLLFSQENLAQEKSDLERKQELFSRGEGIAHNPSSWEYQYIQQQLADYPLLPYIELKTLMRYPYLSNKEKIDKFLTAYENTPMDAPLRKKWLHYLARKDQKALFLHYYRDIGDPELTCIYLDYQLSRKDMQQQALDHIDQLWLVGKSQPKACDPIFDQWQQAGRRTNDMVWQRLVLAADGGKHTLIPYLKKLLPSSQRYLADLWYKTRRDPSYVSRPARFPGESVEKEAEILTYGLKRLIWRDRDLALRSWHQLQKRFDFSPEQQQQVASKFAVALALANHEKAGYWLEKANQLQADDELFRWHLAYILRQQDWQQVLNVIDTVPEEMAKDYSYQYWRARSLEEVDAKAPAQNLFQTLADKRHYYGFMASGKLANKPSLADTPVSFTESELTKLELMPAAQRAKAFLQLKRYVSARREWQSLLAQLDEQQSTMAAVLADSWGWHDQAIFTFGRSGYMDDVKRRFPLAYKDLLVDNAKQQQIDPAWAFAIARKESAFMVDANSGAGAKGLMQLLPGTARYLAKKKISQRHLFEPDVNVKYGTQYLRYLLDKVADNPVLATAAYNAGWRRVKDWGPEQGQLPLDIWIETIPYKETRNYVKSVMAYKQVYQQLLGEETALFEELARMRLSQADFSF